MPALRKSQRTGAVEIGDDIMPQSTVLKVSRSMIVMRDTSRCRFKKSRYRVFFRRKKQGECG
jgi:hypothetical protein